MNEKLVLFLTGVGIHGTFFLHLFKTVPTEPYKQRLMRFYPLSKSSAISEIINALYSLVSCVMVIVETYKISDNNFIDKSFSVDLYFCTFWAMNFIVELTITLSKIKFLFSLRSLVDVVTVVPTLALFFTFQNIAELKSNFVEYEVLKILRIFRLLRLRNSFRYILKKHANKSENTVNLQFVKMVMNLVVGILVMAALFNFMSTVNKSDWGEGPQNFKFHNALYFVVVTMTTVGYGDFSPTTIPGRMVVTVLILVCFSSLPIMTAKIVYLLSIKERYRGKLSADKGNRHLIFCCDPCCMEAVSYAIEMISENLHGIFLPHVLLLVPSNPNQIAKTLILKLGGEKGATYINGDARNYKDLMRARVGQASAVFIISDRYSSDTSIQDGNTLVRAVAVTQVAPHVKLYCSVVHTSTRKQLKRLGVVTAGVVCQGKLINSFLYQACTTPGFTTILNNLLLDGDKEVDDLLGTYIKLRKKNPMVALLGRPSKESLLNLRAENFPAGEAEYLRNLSFSFYSFKIGEYFAGMSFSNTVNEIHKELGLTIIALDVKPDSKNGKSRRNSRVYDGNYIIESKEFEPVLVHPGSAWLISPTDQAFLIATGHADLDRLNHFGQKKKNEILKLSQPRGSIGIIGSLSFNRKLSMTRKYSLNGGNQMPYLMSIEHIAENNRKEHKIPKIIPELIPNNEKPSTNGKCASSWVFVMAHSLSEIKWLLRSLIRKGHSCILLCPFDASHEAADKNTQDLLEKDSQRTNSGEVIFVKGGLSLKGMKRCFLENYDLSMVLIIGGEGYKGEFGYQRDQVSVSLVVLVMSMVESNVRVMTYLNGTSYVEQHEMLSRRIRVTIIKLENIFDKRQNTTSPYKSLRDFNYFSLAGGYSSGDIVLSTVSEALLLCSFLLPGTEALVESLTCSEGAVRRISIPCEFFTACEEANLPFTYREIFEWLLCNYDVICLGIQRHKRSELAVNLDLFLPGHAKRNELKRDPPSHNMLSIASPTSNMELEEDDFLYILLPHNVAKHLSKLSAEEKAEEGRLRSDSNASNLRGRFSNSEIHCQVSTFADRPRTKSDGSYDFSPSVNLTKTASPLKSARSSMKAFSRNNSFGQSSEIVPNSFFRNESVQNNDLTKLLEEHSSLMDKEN